MTREAVRWLRGLLDPLEFLARIARGLIRASFSGARFGRYPIVLGRVRFHIRGDAVIGERFMTMPHAPKPNIDVARGAVLRIGNGSGMGGGASIEVWHEVHIGNNTMVGAYCSIIDDNRHLSEPADGPDSLYRGPTVIGDNVWLTRNVTILPGVTVGAGSVIAPNSVVSRNIPPNSFASGSPARVGKKLEIPDGWNRRFGFAQDDNSQSLWTRLHRAMTNPRDVTLLDVPEENVPQEVVPQDVTQQDVPQLK
jgi:acetyltransferase-like isoleucine patch superfamily enzyme